MARLSDKDLGAVLGAIRSLYESGDVSRFAAHAVQALLRVVPADRCSYNECYRDPERLRILVGPNASDLNGPLREAMAHHGHESPLLSYYRQTRRPDVVTFSDFVSRAQLHRITLYNEYYRLVDVEHQMIVPLRLEADRTRDIGMALSRRHTDFSERDRQVLELLQPHLIQAHANAMALERLSVQQTFLEQVLEAGGRGIVILANDCGVLFASTHSRTLLRDYMGEGSGGRLPESLARWVRRETMKSNEALITAPRKPLVLTQAHRQLTVTLSDSGDNHLLLLEERADGIDPQSLAPLGLTPRQREVLAWLAQGKTNEEIAMIAGARPATVAKHLERIYQKLGVETRTAAAIEALGVAGRQRAAI